MHEWPPQEEMFADVSTAWLLIGINGPFPTPFRVSVCAARTLNDTGQSRAMLSLQ